MSIAKWPFTRLGRWRGGRGADYEDDARIASVQASDAACEHFELWIEEYDKWNDEMHVVNIPIAYCPWCGEELWKEGGDD